MYITTNCFTTIFYVSSTLVFFDDALLTVLGQEVSVRITELQLHVLLLFLVELNSSNTDTRDISNGKGVAISSDQDVLIGSKTKFCGVSVYKKK